MDCKECHERFRADKLIEDFCAEHDIAIEGSVDAWSQEKMMDFIKKGIDANEALEKAKGHYGQWDNAAKYIDPRQE